MPYPQTLNPENFLNPPPLLPALLPVMHSVFYLLKDFELEQTKKLVSSGFTNWHSGKHTNELASGHNE